jgi:hypothetical protein
MKTSTFQPERLNVKCYSERELMRAAKFHDVFQRAAEPSYLQIDIAALAHRKPKAQSRVTAFLQQCFRFR